MAKQRQSIQLEVASVPLRYARTFADVPARAAFWYVNSQGLIGFAINGGAARDALRLSPVKPVRTKP